MLSFQEFVKEEYGIESEYSKPGAPQHDLWKHGLPAIRHRHDHKMIIGKRGERHEDLSHDHAAYEHGILHKKTKQFYRTGKDTHMDSTDLMTARQRMAHDY